MKNERPLDKTDYEEPRCILCNPATGERRDKGSVPMQRIVEKLDQYCDRKEFAAAERHLLYWLEEARINGDLRGEFSLQNELMGFYRKQGQKEKAVESADAAEKLITPLQMESTVSGATTYVNCGTVYDAFGMPGQALIYFEKARDILENTKEDLFRLGSLYNNMGLALTDLFRFKEAQTCYEKALQVMGREKNGQLECAITYMNLADNLSAEKGLDEAEPQVEGYLSKAKELLDTKDLPRDGYYAFVCEKCAPGFSCYGQFAYADELAARAEQIYAAERMRS